MKNRISDPEISKEIVKLQKEQFIASKKDFLITGILSLFLLIFSIVFGSFVSLIVFVVSILDFRKKYINYIFNRSILLLLVSESEVYTKETILE